jgi:hypothetical protein
MNLRKIATDGRYTASTRAEKFVNDLDDYNYTRQEVKDALQEMIEYLEDQSTKDEILDLDEEQCNLALEKERAYEAAQAKANKTGLSVEVYHDPADKFMFYIVAEGSASEKILEPLLLLNECEPE